MSKRTKTNHAIDNPKNFWPTPFAAVAPLAGHLGLGVQYQEPCAGDGAMILHMSRWGHRCVDAIDVAPRSPMVRIGRGENLASDTMIVTNPPFDWAMLEPLLAAWVGRVETWLLLPWDMPCNLRMRPYAAHIDQMLPLGRVSWMGNGIGGFENYGWFHFDVAPSTLILPRVDKGITSKP